MRKFRQLPAALVTLVLLVAAGCSSNGNSGGGGGESSKPLVIGASLPLSGDFSQPGEASHRGYEIWKDMVNKGGGLLGRQVQLKVVDDASDQNTVVADYNRLISQDKVDLVLGTFSSLLNIPASAVAERARKVYVCPSCGSPDMFNRKFTHIFFAQPATAVHQADLFAQWVKGLSADQRPKTAAYPSQDDPFAKPVVDGVKSQLEAAGIKTVYSKVYPADTSNFDTIASGIKNAKPDVIVHGAVFEDGVGLVRSLVKAGYSPKAMFQTSAPSEGDQYSKGIGAANTEGIFYAVSWSPAAKYPLNQEFVQAYQSKYGGTPPEDAADGFAAAQVLQAAVKAVGSLDQEKIADWLHNNKVDTILGPLSWNEAGAPQQAFILAQWQSGEAQIVLPQDVATSQKIVFPKPNWGGQG
ncbi:MAG TPA: amino acid ABC transporter substrate-binding protein [Actinomycetota bacterium]|jgi:branched-chain amino acid transport system substrate-binding protein|nr:amino acid ABC transporter substrate-binding protein [Actinomycetota bacterium]